MVHQDYPAVSGRPGTFRLLPPPHVPGRVCPARRVPTSRATQPVGGASKPRYDRAGESVLAPFLFCPSTRVAGPLASVDVAFRLSHASFRDHGGGGRFPDGVERSWPICPCPDARETPSSLPSVSSSAVSRSRAYSFLPASTGRTGPSCGTSAGGRTAAGGGVRSGRIQERLPVSRSRESSPSGSTSAANSERSWRSCARLFVS